MTILAAELTLFVPGRPAPQGSMRAFVPRPGARPVIVKDNKSAQNTWRTQVAWHAAQVHEGPPLDGPLSVTLVFVMPRPASTPKRRTPPAVKKPDIDKLSRAILDSLTDVVWRDDSQITHLNARKRLAELDETPGVRIRVGPDLLESAA